MVRDDIYELNLAQIIEKLNHFPGWEFDNDKIKKEFKFKDFLDALDFINKLAVFCEAKDHHPDTENKFISSFIFCPEKS